jgi:catechol 2,3-dioxygenase-like lactoylglutathione lyase family enzyme
MLQESPMYAYLPARDVARAREFYEGTLGFRPGKQIAGGVAYEFADDTGCFLYPTENAGTSKASQAFWQVDDVECEVAELKSRGVALENYDMPGERSPSGVITAGGAKVAWFKDTEGNILAMVQGVDAKPTRRGLLRRLPTSRLRPNVVTAAATGALALGAFAIGAIAVGTLAIGRLAVRHARIGRLDIDELRVRKVSAT